MKKEILVKNMMKEAVNLLFPLRCPVCDEPVPIREGDICRLCRDKFKPVREPYCFCCGRPLPAEEKEYCRDCSKKRHLFIRGRALFEYESAAASIYRFKYGGRREYAFFFGRAMAEELEGFIRGVAPDGLVPVPVSKRRLRRRGYNQAGLLAKEIGRKMHIPVYDSLILRSRDTVPQKSLNVRERQNNLKRAFKIAQNDVKLSTIIVVDDIFTTGSTMDAVTEVLLQSGVHNIYFITLAVSGQG